MAATNKECWWRLWRKVNPPSPLAPSLVDTVLYLKLLVILAYLLCILGYQPVKANYAQKPAIKRVCDLLTYRLYLLSHTGFNVKLTLSSYRTSFQRFLCCQVGEMLWLHHSWGLSVSLFACLSFCVSVCLSGWLAG